MSASKKGSRGHHSDGPAFTQTYVDNKLYLEEYLSDVQ